jgi:hypothetical protein
MMWNFCFVLFSAKALDEYANVKAKSFKAAEEEEIDPRLEAIVERMLEKYDSTPLFNDICQFARWLLTLYLFFYAGVS